MDHKSTVKACAVWALGIAFCCSASNAQKQGGATSVYGHVYTSDGKPLPEAKIEVFPLEAAVSGPLPYATTDQDGGYLLVSPAFGLTRICARLESLGYPKTQYKVFSSGKETFPEVRLVAGGELKNVDIHLGPPDGILDGAVVDKETQLPIQDAIITLRWVDDPSVMYSGSLPNSGSFHFALPQRRIGISVTAPQHSGWRYVDPYTHSDFINLQPSEHKTMSIEMERTSA